jgi:hypothetical protein
MLELPLTPPWAASSTITVAQRSQDVSPLCAALATQKAELVSASQGTSAESTFVRPWRGCCEVEAVEVPKRVTTFEAKIGYKNDLEWFL